MDALRRNDMVSVASNALDSALERFTGSIQGVEGVAGGLEGEGPGDYAYYDTGDDDHLYR